MTLYATRIARAPRWPPARRPHSRRRASPPRSPMTRRRHSGLTATDAAGNTSACSSGITYVEDSTPPAAPSGLDSSPASPANNNSPKITGTAEAGATVKVYATANCSGGPAATGSASDVHGARPDGQRVERHIHQLTRRRRPTPPATSRACASAITYVEDSTAPAAPSASPPRPPRRPMTTRPTSPARPRPARRSRSTRRPTAPAPIVGDRLGRRVRIAGLTVTVSDDTTDAPVGHGDRRGRQHVGLLERAELRRGLDRARRPDRAVGQPVDAGQQQRTEGHRHGRASGDGQALPDVRLLRHGARDRLRRRVRHARPDGSASPTTRRRRSRPRPPTPPATRASARPA